MKRYFLRQPRRLEDMALPKLGDWIAVEADNLTRPVSRLQERHPTKAEELVSRKIGVIRKYLDCKLPSIFHNKLLTEVIRALTQLFKKTLLRLNRLQNCVCNVGHIKRMVETLITDKLTYLSITVSTWEIFHESFCFKSYWLTGLTSLELLGSWTEDDIIPLIEKLHSLKCFSLSFGCTENVLRCIAENCKLIETLELTYSDINDVSIINLTQLRNLKSVDLRSVSITKMGIVTLLMFCENLEHIRLSHQIDNNMHWHAYQYKDILTPALEHIATFEENAGKQFKLTSFSCRISTVDQMLLVVKMCPFIQKMTLKKYDVIPHNYFKVLHDMQDLREMKLVGCYFYDDQVKEFLQVKGSNLVLLDLEHGRQIDLNALKYISITCPNLQSLTVSCNVEQKIIVHDSFPCKTVVPPLKCLKNLSLRDGLTNELVFLLSNCPNVELIDVRQIKFADKIMLEVLEKNPKQLMYLKKLRIGETSMLLIDRIVQSCINSLEIN